MLWGSGAKVNHHEYNTGSESPQGHIGLLSTTTQQLPT